LLAIKTKQYKLNSGRNDDNKQQTIMDVDGQKPASPRMERTTMNSQKQARPDLSFGNAKLIACCLTDEQSVYSECGDDDKSSKRGETAGLKR
jgi:hypothetical protein